MLALLAQVQAFSSYCMGFYCNDFLAGSTGLEGSESQELQHVGSGVAHSLVSPVLVWDLVPGLGLTPHPPHCRFNHT